MRHSSSQARASSPRRWRRQYSSRVSRGAAARAVRPGATTRNQSRRNGSSIRYRLRLPDRGSLPNGISRRTSPISPSAASGRARLDAGRPTGDLAHPMGPAADHVQQRTQRHRRRDLLHEQPLRLHVQRPGRIEHQGVHGAVGVQAERLGELPVARHSSPQRVEGNQIPCIGAGEQVGEVSRSEGAYGERFPRAAVERRAGVEYRAVHHPLTRPAQDDAGPSRRAVDPGLEDAGQRRVGSDQVRQLVEHEWPGPAAPARLVGEPRQERTPVGILDSGETGKLPVDGGRQVAALDRRDGLVRDRVQSALPVRPFEEEAGFAYAAPAPEHGQGAWMGQRGIEAAQLVVAVDEFHAIIILSGIMPDNINSAPAPASRYGPH